MKKLKILDECEVVFKEVVRLTQENPEWKYSVNSQILRSALSIESNIAEGSQRNGKDANRFFDIALGSLEECRFQLRMYDNTADLNDIFDKIRAVTTKLKHYKISESVSVSVPELK